jgi:hypothetical protein
MLLQVYNENYRNFGDVRKRKSFSTLTLRIYPVDLRRYRNKPCITCSYTQLLITMYYVILNRFIHELINVQESG